MSYPCLVPEWSCNTDIHIVIHGEGLTEDGGPEILFSDNFMCNYQDTAKTVLTADGKQVQLSGVALLRGDIVPNIPTLSGGDATVFGVKRTIFQGNKSRNPDGTVNYTELRLI